MIRAFLALPLPETVLSALRVHEQLIRACSNGRCCRWKP